MTSKDKKGNVIDLGKDLDILKLKRTDKCSVKCKCDRIVPERQVRHIVEKDSLCIFCRNYNRWDNKSLWDFYNKKKKKNIL